MPGSIERRKVIRSTWLNQTFWASLKIELKVLFIVADDGDALEHEALLHGDILQLSTQESHYILPSKDDAYFDFLESKCSNVDFVFKGDDDILINPVNLGKLIHKMKDRQISASGCLKVKRTERNSPVH